MKNLIIKIKKILVFMLLLLNTLWGYSQLKDEVAVLYLNSTGVSLDPVQLGNLTRIELEKLEKFQVTDRFEMLDIMEKSGFSNTNCYGRSCLIELGKILNVQRIVSGNVEKYGEKIIITLRLIDVNTSQIEKVVVDEYLNLQPQIHEMIALSVKNLFAIPFDIELKRKLTEKFDYESSVRNPGATKVILNGPRMGVAYITGDQGKRLQAKKADGGYDVYNVLSQFGYQHEVQYLNEGNFQAVFEMIGMISGIDQGLFMPSVILMNGFRNNKYGIEFAFGPSFGFVRKANGYYDKSDGSWHLANEWNEKDDNGNPILNPNDEESRFDSRGTVDFSSGFVWAMGKTFKSGHLNIPVNVYVVPGKEGWYLGLTFGFNSRKN